jgi:hypothetical protein
VSDPTRHLPALLRRIVSLAKLRAVVLRFYEVTPDPKTRARAGTVAAVVAREVDVANSPAFRAELRHALRSLGWKQVRVENVALWVGVRHK